MGVIELPEASVIIGLTIRIAASSTEKSSPLLTAIQSALNRSWMESLGWYSKAAFIQACSAFSF
jgi:hypothetical protein